MKSLRTMKQQAGLAILDILVWAGGIILAIAIIGALAFLVTSSGSAVNYSTGVTAIKKCTVDLMYGTADKSGLTEAMVADANCVPGAWVNSGSSELVSPDGGNIAVAGTAGGLFTLTIPDIPSEVCTQMLPGMAGAYSDIRVEGTTVFSSGSLNNATMAAQCASADPVDIAFDYTN